MVRATGNVGIGHVRYPTAGSASAQEAQPFFVNSPLGIYLIHNGNLTNVDALRHTLEGSQSFFNRHLRTESDSEVTLAPHQPELVSAPIRAASPPAGVVCGLCLRPCTNYPLNATEERFLPGALAS